VDKLTTIGKKAIHISQDDFYRDKTQEEMVLIRRGEFNFDVPNLIDYENFLRTLVNLINREEVSIPIYSFKTSNVVGQKQIPNINYDVIIVEGLYVLYNDYMLKHFDIKVFIDTKEEIRFKRRLKRDMTERKQGSKEELINNYIKFVVPGYDKYIYPTRRKADIIIGGDGKYNNTVGNNKVFYDLICKYAS